MSKNLDKSTIKGAKVLPITYMHINSPYPTDRTVVG